MITATVGAAAALVGGPNGFTLCIPGVLLSAAIATSVVGAICCAAPVVAAGALAAASAHAGTIPPLWAVVLVPGTSVLVLHGMTRRLRRERDAMADAAWSDPLTGLANRRKLMSIAEYEISRHRRAGGRFPIVMLDLDGFKLLNDRFGHAAGDEMLCEVGRALTGALRSQDMIARLGGDEFCVIAPDTENPRVLSEKVVAAVAHAASGYAALQTSVGVAVFPDDGATIETLLRTADARLLAAKRSRRTQPQRRAA